jgi:hypothetical protein
MRYEDDKNGDNTWVSVGGHGLSEESKEVSTATA